MQNSELRIQKQSVAIRRSFSAFIILHSAFCLGCAGYQIGNRALYRPDIRTVHVPVIQSDSYRRYLGERLTEAVVKEIELRTPYKVVDAASADSVLTVRLVSDSKRVLANNRFSEPRDIETDFFIQTNWIDSRGDLIMTQDNLPASPLLVNLGQQAKIGRASCRERV